MPHDPVQGPQRPMRDADHWSVTLQQGHELRRQGESIARQEVALSSLEEAVERGNKDAHRDSERLFARLDELSKPKPPVQWVPVAGLCLMILGAFGTVMVFLFSLTTGNLQREGDLRIAALVEKENMAIADIRTKQDALESFTQEQIRRELEHARQRGYEAARRDGLEQRLTRLEQE